MKIRPRFLSPAILAALAWAMIACDSTGSGLGNVAPEFESVSYVHGGGKAGPQTFRGKVVLLEFWSTTCGPCRMVQPVVEELNKKYRDRGLEVMAITQDSPGEITPFLQEHPIGYPIYMDQTGEANRRYGIEYIPSLVVIDRSGKIAWTIDGFGDGVAEQLEDAIVKAL